MEQKWIKNPIASVFENLVLSIPASEYGILFILHLMERLKTIIIFSVLKWFHSLRAVFDLSI